MNGFKIANPTILDHIPLSELTSLFVGYRYEPIIVEGSDPGLVHPAMAKALDYCFDKIANIEKIAAETDGILERPVWPMADQHHAHSERMDWSQGS
jgi:xylulose-5-phosphate/fructose-6-phosphate phosphoketolase